MEKDISPILSCFNSKAFDPAFIIISHFVQKVNPKNIGLVILEGPPKKATPTRTIKGFALWAIFLRLPLTSKLDALCAGNANLVLRFAQNKGEPYSMARQKKKPPTVVGGFFFWWAIKGSNLGPTGYEPVALTN